MLRLNEHIQYQGCSPGDHDLYPFLYLHEIHRQECSWLLVFLSYFLQPFDFVEITNA